MSPDLRTSPTFAALAFPRKQFQTPGPSHALSTTAGGAACLFCLSTHRACLSLLKSPSHHSAHVKTHTLQIHLPPNKCLPQPSLFWPWSPAPILRYIKVSQTVIHVFLFPTLLVGHGHSGKPWNPCFQHPSVWAPSTPQS